MGEVGVSDWRNNLVSAISRVFSKERETLLAELRTHVVASPSTELSSLQRLEQKIRDQVHFRTLHWTRMHCVLIHRKSNVFEYLEVKFSFARKQIL